MYLEVANLLSRQPRMTDLRLTKKLPPVFRGLRSGVALSFLLLVFGVGCQTDKLKVPGLHLDYRGKAGHRVVGPIGTSATVLYDFTANNSHELVRVSQVRETDSSVEVAVIYTISQGGASTGPIEYFTFSKTEPTRVTLMTGGEVTGVYR